MRAALIDDDAELLDTITFLIAHRGINVTPFLSAAAFRAAHAQAPFDILVADAALGTESGYEVVREFLAALPHARAFVLTGSIEPAPEALTVTILRKPLELETLFDSLEELMKPR